VFKAVFKTKNNQNVVAALSLFKGELGFRKIPIGAGSGGQGGRRQGGGLEIFWPPLDDFCPNSDFYSGSLFSGNAGYWVKKKLQILFLRERWTFGQ